MKKRMEGCPHKNHEHHIAVKGIKSLSRYIPVHNFSYASSTENTRRKSSSGEGNGKTREITGMAADESQKQKKEVIDETSKEGKKVHF